MNAWCAERAVRRRTGFAPCFYETNPFLGAFSGGPRDVYIHGGGRRNDSLGVAGGLNWKMEDAKHREQVLCYDDDAER